MSTLNVENISDGTSTIGISSTSKGSAKAWCQVNILGVLTSSYNVSSITDVGTGKRTINYTNPLPSSTYCSVTSNAGSSSGGNWDITIGDKSTTSCLVTIKSGAGSLTDQGFDLALFAN